MNTHLNRWPVGWGARQQRRSCRIALDILFGLAASVLVHPARADNFSKVHYDVRTDQLVVTMNYRGTNPDHAFSLQWGQCQQPAGSNLNEVAVEVLDSQWQDAALRPFKKTVRFNLSDMPCRPAKVTLRTAPRFIYTLLIPAGNVRLPHAAGQ